MDTNRNKDVIDLKAVFQTLWQQRRTFYRVLPVVFVLSCIWIFPQPRYYTSSVKLAPEFSGEMMDAAGGLSSLASSFGFNLGGMGTSDAIYPLLYPELFESPQFVSGLFKVQVRTKDGSLQTDYYTYLRKHQKKNPLTRPFNQFRNWVKSFFQEKVTGVGHDGLDPFWMNRVDYGLYLKVGKQITCNIDKKTDVTTITVKDQDPLVSATMADSVRVHLQDFITDYRTSKARLDAAHYRHLADSARLEYEAASKIYSDYVDRHKEVSMQSYISRRDELEADMGLKLNAYTAMMTQLQAMDAKVQEKTPAFTVLKSATVPPKPAGPKRMLFILGMLILSTIVLSLYLAKDEMIKQS
ncbi:MAG: chain-length determining protein [Bacteroidaceae bacterium]|nr:chain-length determining protein [Bacteroidaceae bacterium]